MCLSYVKCTFGQVSMAPTSLVVYLLPVSVPDCLRQQKQSYHESTMDTRCLDNINLPFGTQNTEIEERKPDGKIGQPAQRH